VHLLHEALHGLTELVRPAAQAAQLAHHDERVVAQAPCEALFQRVDVHARARGFEVTLKTEAEMALRAELGRIHNSWSLTELEDVANKYQHDLCDEHFHLDRIDPKAKYNVSTITVPVFVLKQIPIMCFVAGSADKPISGAQIENIAMRMKESADRITALASGRETVG